MKNQNLFKAYLNDIHLINEDRNFSGTFKTPKHLAELGVDAEELECQIIQSVICSWIVEIHHVNFLLVCRDGY